MRLRSVIASQCTQGEGAHVNPNDQGGVVDGREVTSRRNVLIGGASLAAMVWAAPAVSRLSAVHGAENSPPPPDCDAVEPGDGSETFSTTGADITFTPPANVTSITVVAWGGGGGGARAGGGGAANSTLTLDVVPCRPYTVRVGAGGGAGVDGEDSTFADGATVLVRASGGAGAVGTTAGAGGLSSDSIGSARNGGSGGGTTGNGGGGGGGSAGTEGVGGTGGTGGGSGGAGGAAGTGSPPGASGGPGGNNNAAGTPGSVPGAGGGGAGNSSGAANGGAGARGEVRISYTATAI